MLSFLLASDIYIYIYTYIYILYYYMYVFQYKVFRYFFVSQYLRVNVLFYLLLILKHAPSHATTHEFLLLPRHSLANSGHGW